MSAAAKTYWQERDQRCAAQAQACVLRETPVELGNPCARYDELTLSGLDGAPIAARLIRPADVERAPVVLMYHDATRDLRGWHHMTRFVALGCAVVALQNRPGVREVLVEEPLAVGDGLGVTMRVMGEEPPRTGRVLSSAAAAAWEATLSDALVLAHVLPRLEGLDATRVFTWGEGLGAGLALAVAALAGASAAVALNPLPCALDASCATLDVACLAEGLACPVLLGTCEMDLQATPQAQDLLVAGLDQVRQIRYPRYGHERVNAFEDEMFSFLVAQLAQGRRLPIQNGEDCRTGA